MPFFVFSFYFFFPITSPTSFFFDIISSTDLSSSFCLTNRHLSDPTHRQTYESAHSVILAIFASHAQRQQQYLAGSPSSDSTQASPPTAALNPEPLGKQKHSRMVPGVINFDAEAKKFGSEGNMIERDPVTSEEAKLSAAFMKYMIPFYAKCLIDVSYFFFNVTYS